MFRVTGLKILGRVGKHFFFFFSGKKYDFMHFEGHLAPDHVVSSEAS